MDLTENLRRQARRYRCGACSQNMAECHIQILEHRENVALIQVTCASCREESHFQIVFPAMDQRDDDLMGETGEEPELPNPITSDELLDVHLALARHAGGLKDLVAL